MKNVLKQLAKRVLKPLGLTAAVSATDSAIHKKMFGSGLTTMIILNEETHSLIKIDKSLGESALLIKDISETIKSEAKEQKGGFLSMLLGTLVSTLIGNLLTGKGTVRTGQNF